jgi:hypothetical protein
VAGTRVEIALLDLPADYDVWVFSGGQAVTGSGQEGTDPNQVTWTATFFSTSTRAREPIPLISWRDA